MKLDISFSIFGMDFECAVTRRCVGMQSRDILGDGHVVSHYKYEYDAQIIKVIENGEIRLAPLSILEAQAVEAVARSLFAVQAATS